MKMSNIHMELEELAQEKGFESLSEALQAGCEAKYDEDTVELLDPLEAAHRAWEKEKADVLEGLKSVYNDIDVPVDDKAAIKNAIKFIEKAHE